MHWYITVLKKYAVFSGRARRKEFWFFVLFNLLVSLVLGIFDGLLGTARVGDDVGLLGAVYGLVVLVPGIAVMVRRLHDIGRTGWWVLIGFVPLVGTIVLIVFAVLDSQPGSNAYGPNPKGGGETA